MDRVVGNVTFPVVGLVHGNDLFNQGSVQVPARCRGARWRCRRSLSNVFTTSLCVKMLQHFPRPQPGPVGLIAFCFLCHSPGREVKTQLFLRHLSGSTTRLLFQEMPSLPGTGQCCLQQCSSADGKALFPEIPLSF